MLSPACGTPMHQYFWHLMKKPQKVNFLKKFLIIYFKIYIMDNIVLPCLKKILVLILNAIILVFMLYTSMGKTSTIQKKAPR